MSDGEKLVKRVFDPTLGASAAGARSRSEGLTLVCAVTVAVALGGLFGMWINARLAPAPSAGTPRPVHLLPDARASAQPAPPASPAPAAARPSPCDGCETSSAGVATPARVPADRSDEADEGRPATGAVAPTGVARAAEPAAAPAPTRTDEVANASAEPHGATAPEAVATPTPDPSRPVAWEVSPLPKPGGSAAARANVERGAAQVGERPAAGAAPQPPPGPCVPYASASSLGVRVGGAAPLILGGPGVGVRVNVSTPDRSELAVIYEGPAGGDKGWLRYSVRSIGRRPGRYTVRYSTPCGSQTIPVTVK